MGMLEEAPFQLKWRDTSHELSTKDFAFPMINQRKIKKQSNLSPNRMIWHRRPKTNLESEFEKSIQSNGYQSGRYTEMRAYATLDERAKEVSKAANQLFVEG